jgi:23S rRNA (uracil1939-C5)-methyltransferase
MAKSAGLKDEIHEIEVQALVYGGDAMGRLADGRALFVTGALPGERVRVRLTEQKRGFARGELMQVLVPSLERIPPPPPQAGCPGCHYAHMAYPTQLRYKTEILRDQLQRIAGIADPPVADMIASPKEWRYRNAVQFHLTASGRLGFQVPGSHRVVEAEDCLLCEPAIQEILPMLDFEAVPGLARIQVRAGAGDSIMLVLESDDINPPDLTIDLADISVLFQGPEGLPPIVMAGDDYLVMEALEQPFRVSAGSFFQVNTAQAENMVRYLLERLPLTPETQVLEVYAGVGLFSAFLAPRVARLVAVESSPPAVEDFAVNLDAFDNVDLYEGAAEDVLPGLTFTEGQTPNLVLVDPPRAGLALPALDALARLGAPLLAYISCDPATLARDIKRLMNSGYRLESAQPFDMFPQTYHVESVVLMSRA